MWCARNVTYVNKNQFLRPHNYGYFCHIAIINLPPLSKLYQSVQNRCFQNHTGNILGACKTIRADFARYKKHPTVLSQHRVLTCHHPCILPRGCEALLLIDSGALLLGGGAALGTPAHNGLNFFSYYRHWDLYTESA